MAILYTKRKDLETAFSLRRRTINAHLIGEDLRGLVVPDGTTFSQGSFRNSDLRGAILDDVHIDHCDFTEANLEGVSLRNARIQSSSFRSANAQQLAALGSSWLSCDLRKADMGQSDFFSARFAECVFDKVQCELCNFSRAHLSGEDLSGAHLLGADFRGAILERTQLPSQFASYAYTDAEDRSESGIDFSRIDLMISLDEIPASAISEFLAALDGLQRSLGGNGLEIEYEQLETSADATVRV